MNKEERKEHYRLKNERRKLERKRDTLYAVEAREGRRSMSGTFGKQDPSTFNKLSEGTTAMRRAESDLTS